MNRRLKNLKAALATVAASLLLMLSTLSGAVYAAESPYIIDDYGLLDSSTQSQMEAQAETMATTYDVGTYLLVVDDIGSSSARDFAKARWNASELGVGDSKSGILFMIAVDSRDYVTITHGDGVTYFTDYQIGEMEDEIVSYLKDDQWTSACQSYLDLCSSTLAFAAEHGEALDSNNAPVDWSEKLPVDLGVAFAVALVVALITRKALKGQLKSVAAGGNARAYLQGSLNLTHSTESHLGTTVSKTPIPKHDEGGGSRVDSGGFGGSAGGKF